MTTAAIVRWSIWTRKRDGLVVKVYREPYRIYPAKPVLYVEYRRVGYPFGCLFPRQTRSEQRFLELFELAQPAGAGHD